MSELALQRIAENKKTGSPILNLRQCGLKEIPKEISELKWLTSLNLSDNRIIDISPLAQLQQLTYLNLSSNQIVKIYPIVELKRLTHLYLKHNQIIYIDALSKLKQLTHLDLGQNQITDITPISELKWLTALYLECNQITDVTSVSRFKQLKLLCLGNNEIKYINPISELKWLNYLSLSNNKIQNIAPLLPFIKKNISIYLNNNPLTTPPLKIIEEGNQAIVNYFEKLKKQGEDDYENILTLLELNKLKEAVACLKKLDVQAEYKDRMIAILGDLNAIITDENRGYVERGDIRRDKSRIRQRILSLAEDVCGNDGW